MAVKFFPVQKEEDFIYTYPYEFYIEASSDEEFEEVVDWCAQHATAEWSYMWVTCRVNMRPQEPNDIPYAELKQREHELETKPWDWLAHGAYCPYLRIMFSSSADASLFKLSFFEEV